MKITRLSPFSGKTHTLDIPISQEQMDQYKSGNGHIQDIMPHLDPDQREFIMTGITKEEWDIEFADEEDEDED